MAVRTLQAKIAEVVQLTQDVAAFRLEHPDSAPLPSFDAGAHIDVHLPGDFVRQYSLCSCPTERDHYVIAVKREAQSRGGSAAIHKLKPGALVTISEPRNAFPIHQSADFHLLLAGGIGITPLLCMARHLQLNKMAFKLEFFTRSLDATPFRGTIEGDLAESARLNTELDPDQVRSRLEEILAHRPSGAHLYICGPAPFIELATNLAKKNWPAATVHLEHFAPLMRHSVQDNKPFRVKLAQSNREFLVPVDKSILDVLRENKIPCDSSCGEGICGSCMVAVVEGDAEHRDSYLSVDEKSRSDVMMICVSRARGEELTIDL